MADTLVATVKNLSIFRMEFEVSKDLQLPVICWCQQGFCDFTFYLIATDVKMFPNLLRSGKCVRRLSGDRFII